MLIAGAIVAVRPCYVEFVFSPPIWLHLIVWLPLVAALSLGLMRPGKGADDGPADAEQGARGAQ